MTESSTRVKLYGLIVSFPKLFTADPGPDADNPRPMYGAALIAPTTTQQSQGWKQLQAAIKAVAVKRFGAEKGPKMLEAGKIKVGIRDDGEDKGHPEGSLFFNARSKDKPGLVSVKPDPDNPQVPRKITEEDQVVGGEFEIYSGCVVNASVSPYYFDKAGNKGIAFALHNVQKFGEGERLDNRVSADKEFEAVMSDAPESLDDQLPV